jgi:hypothetical protein
MQPRVRNNSRGSLVLESILVLPLSALLLAFFLEVARRPVYEIAAQWASFCLARQALVKGSTQASAEARDWLRSTLRGLPVRQKKAVVERMADLSWESQVFIRFPSLQRDVRKHFQLSRRCRFSFPY